MSFIEEIRQYYNEIKDIPLLSPAEELELGKMIKEGSPQEREAAKNKLVKHNLRLVVSFVNRYVNCGIPVEDLIQEGNIGLIKAAEGFDYTKGFRYCTYANKWIIKMFLQALNEQSKTITLPTHMAESLTKINKIAKDLSVTLNREPSAEDIAPVASMSVEEVEELLALNGNISSIDSTIGDGETTIGETIASNADEKLPSTEEIVEDSMLYDELLKLMCVLDEREKAIISFRYGIGSDKQITLDKLADEYGVTATRIHQIERDAIRKLRSVAPPELSDYIR